MFDYEKAFEQAIAEDEKGHWRAARMHYVRAGQLLIEQAPYVSPEDYDSLVDSVQRLLAAATEMKHREEAERAQRLQKTSAGAGSRASSGSDDDEIDFLPIPERPNVHFEDIAGLDEAKRVIREEIIYPYQHPEIYERFHQDTNGGILLYGLPGTGKTMLARAIATETDADFFSIRCSDIVGKYFGEAERRIRALFDAARSSGNAIIFFDEFDALGCKRGGHSTVMNRVVPELLAQMDGFEKASGRLILIAASNRPWALDSGFLRKPRLTHHIYVPLPDENARRYLLQRKFSEVPRQEHLDLERLVAATEGFNCADITNAFDQCTRGPIRRGIASNDCNQQITSSDIEYAILHSHSSVQPDDLKQMKSWLSNCYRGQLG